ncbi:hypothetical protein U0Q17_01655 [Lactiplantibacillus plantarum]|uniref:collagen-like protein n=1 Tax=Lactiplantibacillus plantarum TaxID=1590 RepID=UPI002AC8B9E4|nr:collagen-like protein [Lactiplantibacillus plantarum]WPW65725.1 hypothetical protein U0Q17_01655 [Lactiplantibacillus plantarum]
MAKTLSFTDTSPQTVKIGDTTTSFTLICGNDNVATDLTKATSITVKFGNASGYLKSTTVDPASLTDPTTGQVTVNFNADLMTSLTAGSYSIEVWVVDSTGTSIYPSDGSTGFTITNNIQSTNGSVITTITFDDFVKELNKAASTIDKGDKGDDGLSAYQVAVSNGYHGSQTDWLASLVGPQGATPDLSNYTTVTDLNNGLSTKVTDNKNGTISVNGTSILPANENVIDRIDTSYTDMNDVLMGWHYLNGWDDVSKLANWGLPQDLYYIHCFKSGYGVSTNIQIAYGVELNNTYMRTAFGTNWKTWKLLADDSKVLHLSTGGTASRPTGISTGYQYFDASLNKPIWYTGKNWVDATGTTV